MRGRVAVMGCLALAACSGGCGAAGGDSAGQSVTEGEDNGSTATPEAVQLLYISDSTGWRTGEAYAAQAQEALDVPVELVDWRGPSLSMGGALDHVRREPEVVAEAEIVVLWGSPMASGVREGHEHCAGFGGYADPGEYDAEDWEPFATSTGETLAAIWAARENQPTILLVTDAYTPAARVWEEHGILDACMAVWEGMSRAVEQAAGEHGATFVSALDVYNGADRQQDPREAGMLSGDNIHPGPAGAEAMAQALAAAGFDPAPAP